MLAAFPQNLFCVPGLFLQHFLFACVAFNEIFNFSEYHFHEYRLGANPTAKQPAKRRRKQDDKYNERDHRQTKNEKVLGPENFTE